MEFNYINKYLIDREIMFSLEWPFDKEIKVNGQSYHKVHYTLRDVDRSAFDELISSMHADCYCLDQELRHGNASVTFAFKSGVWRFNFSLKNKLAE